MPAAANSSPPTIRSQGATTIPSASPTAESANTAGQIVGPACGSPSSRRLLLAARLAQGRARVQAEEREPDRGHGEQGRADVFLLDHPEDDGVHREEAAQDEAEAREHRHPDTPR